MAGCAPVGAACAGIVCNHYIGAAVLDIFAVGGYIGLYEALLDNVQSEATKNFVRDRVSNVVGNYAETVTACAEDSDFAGCLLEGAENWISGARNNIAPVMIIAINGNDWQNAIGCSFEVSPIISPELQPISWN